MNETNSTTNAILVILLVIVVGFIVWYVVGNNKTPEPASGTDSTSEIQVILPVSGGSGSN